MPRIRLPDLPIDLNTLRAKASRPITTRGFVSEWLPCMSR